MKKHTPISLAVLLLLNSLAFALEFNALTIFGCDGEGSQIRDARWNSGPADDCWDIFLYQGDREPDPKQIKWLNDPQTRLVKFTPGEGSTTYTFHFDDGGEIPPYFGLNLFVEGQRTPAISVFAPVTRDPAKPQPFAVNRSANTMSWPEGCWPMGSVPAAGSASCDGIQRSLWIHNDTAGGMTYTITEFKVLTPAAAGNLDCVAPGEVKASGTSDYVGQFTIQADKRTAPPADWLLWLSTRAGMRIAPNNPDGQWKQKYDWEKAQAPFWFTYDGKSSRDFLKNWKFTTQQKQVDQNRISHVLTWKDPATGLEVRWEGLEYTDFQCVEWTVYLTNTGGKDSPILENIQALNADFNQGAEKKEFLLHHWKGTFITEEDYAPQSTLLERGKEYYFEPTGHRKISTSGVWPYYNLESGSEGVLIAIGWPGCWYAKYQRNQDNGLHLSAGQKVVHFSLRPGEMVRTPLITLQFWKGGDWIDAQNVWRQWMIQYNVPRYKGRQMPLPMLNACSSHQFAEMTKANEQNQMEFLDSYLRKGLKLDFWWMDAGWYVGAAEKGWPWTGTWEVDRSPNRFPRGLRAVSDYAHNKGVDIIVWFEPERVAAGTWLTTEHPEWVLGGAEGGVLNMGDPQALDWVVNHISNIITEEAVDLYRQDYNIDPFPFWQKNDTENRQGISENKYVMGYLAYWDELLKRHPGMVIDSCSSGGHRLDLETMRRAVTLTRSDYLFEPVGQQGHTFGLSFWLPFTGTGYAPSNTAGWGWGAGQLSYGPYPRRSNMCPSNTACFDFRVPVEDELVLKLYNEWREIGPNYFGDFYPLTKYNLSQEEWLAWQFNRPEAGEGFVQAFRRADCMYKCADLKMRGLDPDAVYVLKNYDVEEQQSVSGRELMEQGITVWVPEKPGAATLRYVKKK